MVLWLGVAFEHKGTSIHWEHMTDSNLPCRLGRLCHSAGGQAPELIGGQGGGGVGRTEGGDG